VWEREEAKDHPVVDKSIRQRAKHPGYGKLCARQWSRFAAEIESHPHISLHTLEGCFFQSTVRFLLEQDRPFDEALSYLRETERSLIQVGTRLIYLTQPAPGRYLRESLTYRKGADIVDRIARYTESTPFAKSRGVQGMTALIALYSEYRTYCDELVLASQLPRLEIDAIAHNAREVAELACTWLGDCTGAA
jgi:hypothetical protein